MIQVADKIDPNLDIGVQSDSSSDSSSSSSSSGSSSEESDNDEPQDDESVSQEQTHPNADDEDESDSNHVHSVRHDDEKLVNNKSLHEDADEYLNSSNVKKRKIDQDTNCNVKDTNYNRELTTKNAKNYK